MINFLASNDKDYVSLKLTVSMLILALLFFTIGILTKDAGTMIINMSFLIAGAGLIVSFIMGILTQNSGVIVVNSITVAASLAAMVCFIVFY